MTPDTDPNPECVRRRVLFSGRVQGVGFRYTTEAVASRFQVTGWVRNVRDGRVELVAEGLPDDCGRLQHLLLSFGQPIDARGQHRLHARWDWKRVDGRGEPICAALAYEVAALDQRLPPPR